MLAYTLSYHQISPWFLEYIFPFGQQEYSRHFHSIGFKANNMVKDHRSGLRIPEVGRSGHELRLMYAPKAVESSPNEMHWPWSIRLVAVYHSFDVKTSRSTWMIIKGNGVIKERIMELSNDYKNTDVENTEFHLVFVLQGHLLLCQWIVENCPSYISFIEGALQKKFVRRYMMI
jgi:hypothetical protein